MNHQKKKSEDGQFDWVPVARFRIIFSINLLKNSAGMIQQNALIDTVRGFLMRQSEIKETLLKLEVRWPAGFEVCKTCKHPACKISELMKTPKDERPKFSFASTCILKGKCHSYGKVSIQSPEYTSGSHFRDCVGEKALIKNGYKPPVRATANVAEDSLACPKGSFSRLFEEARLEALNHDTPSSSDQFSFGKPRDYTEIDVKRQKAKAERFRKQQAKRKERVRFFIIDTNLLSNDISNYMNVNSHYFLRHLFWVIVTVPNKRANLDLMLSGDTKYSRLIKQVPLVRRPTLPLWNLGIWHPTLLMPQRNRLRISGKNIRRKKKKKKVPLLLRSRPTLQACIMLYNPYKKHLQ